MKQLARKPLLSAFLLAIPLWIVFDNYIVAISVALLVAFLVSMSYALYRLNAGSPPGVHPHSDAPQDSGANFGPDANQDRAEQAQDMDRSTSTEPDIPT